ncbi:hypothetical protein [Bradyrhizobium liaoningense]
MTLLRLSTRIWAGFSVANWTGAPDNSVHGCDNWETVSQSRAFPPAACAQSRSFPITPHEIRALIAPRRERRDAFLMRPMLYRSAHGYGRSCGMVLSRFRCSSEAALAVPSGLAAETIVLDSSDWARHAAGIVRNIPALSRPPDFSSNGRSGLPAMAFDLPRISEIRIRDCAPSSLAILDALAAGRRAVFGLQSFAEEGEFLLAVANAVALLPRSLRSDISVAAGFAKPVADALVQWIDGHVSPPRPGSLAAAVLRLPPEMRAEEVSSCLFGVMAANDASLRPISDQGICEDVFQAHARNHLASVLGRSPQSDYPGSRTPSGIWQAVVRASFRQQGNISLELAQSAACVVDCTFGDAPRPNGMDFSQSVSRSGGCIESLRTGMALAHADPAAVADSICAIEETLALAKIIANRLRWTPGLTAMTRRAIGELRKVVIGKPASDIGVNASLLRALERAPQCTHILAALVEADDRLVTRGIEQAVAALAPAAARLEKVRGWAAGSLLGNNKAEENNMFAVRGAPGVFRSAGMPLPRSANDASGVRALQY